jgi:hypothetical protein
MAGYARRSPGFPALRGDPCVAGGGRGAQRAGRAGGARAAAVCGHAGRADPGVPGGQTGTAGARRRGIMRAGRGRGGCARRGAGHCAGRRRGAAARSGGRLRALARRGAGRAAHRVRAGSGQLESSSPPPRPPGSSPGAAPHSPAKAGEGANCMGRRGAGSLRPAGGEGGFRARVVFDACAYRAVFSIERPVAAPNQKIARRARRSAGVNRRRELHAPADRSAP